LGSECCVAAGDSGCEAYTAIAAQCVLCQSAFPSVPALAPAMYDLSWLNPTPHFSPIASMSGLSAAGGN
jgi:hypothetical protein